MAKFVVRILQGSAATQTVLGGLVIQYICSCFKFPIVCLMQIIVIGLCRSYGRT